MPAAELSRLQAQISAISTQFETPREFVKSLTSLMELYSDMNSSIGDSIKITVLMPTYRLPMIVTRQLEIDLSCLTKDAPDHAVKIMDILWQKSFYESRYCAIVMLGSLPIEMLSLIRKRFFNWMQPDLEKSLKIALLVKGSLTLRQRKLDEWLLWAQKWIENKDQEYSKVGIQALIIVCSEADFSNYPSIFKIIQPVFSKPIFPIQKELTELFKIIIKRVPVESVSFFHSILKKSQSNEIHAFIRRILPFYDNDLQQSLKSAIT